MKNRFMTLAAVLSFLTFTACKHTQKASSAATTGEGLVTEMSVPSTIKTGNPVMLKFTVYNKSGKELQFCKWHTPFEGFMSSFLDITSSNNTEVLYRGIMAKRIMPPPAEAYIKVPAGKSVSVDIDLLKGYNLSAPATYKAVYQASGMSGLEKVNEVTFTITE
jgi:hypothetical protein